MNRLALLLLVACHPKQDEFAVDAAAAQCQLYDDCGVLVSVGYEATADCETDITAWYDTENLACEGYDRKAAQACVDGIVEMDCDALYDQTWPTACDTSALCDGGDWE